MLSHAIVLASSMFDVSSRAKLSVSALAERKIASARPRKYGLLLRAEEEMLLYGQALASPVGENGACSAMPWIAFGAVGSAVDGRWWLKASGEVPPVTADAGAATPVELP